MPKGQPRESEIIVAQTHFCSEMWGQMSLVSNVYFCVKNEQAWVLLASMCA
jgi:hypothetical protein